MARYQSPRDAARWVTIALGLVIALDVVQSVADVMQVDLLHRMGAAQSFTHEEVVTNDSRVAAIAIMYLTAFLASAVTFILWFRRVHENARAFGGEFPDNMRSPGWSFAIPFVNLVRPYQIMKAVWEKSGEYSLPPAIFSLWWAGWIATNLLARVGQSLTNEAKANAESLATATNFDVFQNMVDLAAATCAILVIRALTARQVERGKLGDGVADAFD